MTTRRLRRANLVTIALITFILAMSATAAWLLVNYRNAFGNDSVAAQEIGRMRSGVVLMLDLNRLQDLAVALELGAPLDDAMREELVAEADRIHVRKISFDRAHVGVDRPEVAALAEALVTVIAAVDDLAQAEEAAPQERTAGLRARITQAQLAIARHFDRQQKHHQIALDGQHDAFAALLSILPGVVAAFAGIGTLAVLFWRAEVVAREHRRAAEEEAQFLAFHDPLTRLGNRAGFTRALARALADHEDPLLILADLDSFKAINDAHGHAAGDAVLVGTGDRLQAFAAPLGGQVARLGGDEFAVVLPGPVAAEARSLLCRNLIDTVSGPLRAGGIECEVRLCIGLASPLAIPAARLPDVEELIRAADLALYAAKGEGSGQFRLFDAAMQEQASAVRALREAMPEALAAGEFCVFYQPQVELLTGRLHGFEALVRWRRGGLMISPAQFVPIAEESGFILALDFFVLGEAARAAAAWNRTAANPVTVSVNFSALHFRDSDLADRVLAIIGPLGLPPGVLTIEITESVLIRDWETVSATLAGLAAAGISVSLDDFGTGYSSMSYLRRLQVQEVKIDRSFVLDVEHSTQTRMVLDGLVDILDALGMRLVVEGIETEGQARLVRSLGAGIGQGWLFGRPMEEPEAGALVPQAETAARA